MYAVHRTGVKRLAYRGERGWVMASSTLLAYISGVALLIAVVSVIALHFGEKSMTPIRDAVSHYVHTPLGVLYYVQVVATGISALTLLVALRVQGEAHSRNGYIALGLYGVARLVIALFPADPKGAPITDRGRVHLFLAIITFAAVPTMTLPAVRPAPKPRPTQKSAIWAALKSAHAIAAHPTVVRHAP